MIRRTPQLLLIAAISTVGAMGQPSKVNPIVTLCSNTKATSLPLICQFPFGTGVFSNDSALGSGTTPIGILPAVEVTTSLNVAIASQVSQLPLATAAAGEVTVTDKNGIPSTIYDLGPILTDRARTIGKKKVFLGFTATQFVFTDIDGNRLGRLPFTYYRTAYYPGTNKVWTNTYTQEETALEFRINQFVGVATVGITKKIDASVIVPIERVSLGDGTYDTTNYVFDANNNLLSRNAAANTSIPGVASGVGDIIFNFKREMWSTDRATISGAVNVRTPTGDDRNFLGSGAWGFNPYVVYSYQSRFSPHVKIGYQWNTSTELNNPLNSSTGLYEGKKSLPGGVVYDVGAEYAVGKHWNFMGDLLGSQFLNTPRLATGSNGQASDIGGINFITSVTQSSSYSINNVSAGLKLRPKGNLVLAGNVLFQLNNNGLRSRPTPLFGISYTFH